MSQFNQNPYDRPFDRIAQGAMAKMANAGMYFQTPPEGSDAKGYLNVDEAAMYAPPVKSGHHLSGSGYGDWKFNHRVFRERVKRVAYDLPEVMCRHDADSVAVRGTSGIFLVAALQMLIDVPVMLMRKPGERSNGNRLEGKDSHHYRRFVIIDDFICGGGTVKGMIEDAPKAECVAMLMHTRSDCPGYHITEYQRVGGVPVYEYK